MLSMFKAWLHRMLIGTVPQDPPCEPPDSLSLRESFDMPPFHPRGRQPAPCCQ